MPFQHLVSHENRTIFTRVIGDLSVGDIIDDIRKFAESPKVPPNFNRLIDLRQSTRARSYDEAQRIVAAFKLALGKFSRRIVILASEASFYGASRMTATLAELGGYDAHAARSEEEACELLGIKSLPSDEQFSLEGFEL